MGRRRIHRHLAVVAVLGFGVAACGGDSTDDTASPAASVTDVDHDETPVDTASDETSGSDDSGTDAGAVPEILRFTAPLVGGGEIDAATLAGTPTAFWFWAPT